MPGWPASDFPSLTPDSYTPTSPVDFRYNCIAWAAGDQSRRWWPDLMGIGYWPPGAPREETVPAFVAAFAMQGYEVCNSGQPEPGLEKIAIYAVRDSGLLAPTHAARQLNNGNWTSKLGDFDDIEHAECDSLNGPIYGSVVVYMRRVRT